MAVHFSSLSIPKFPAPPRILSHSLRQLKEDRSFVLGQAFPITLLRSRHQAPLCATHSLHRSFKSTSGYDKYCWGYFSIGFFYEKKKRVMRNKYHFVLGFTAYWALSLKGFKSHHAPRESCSEKEEVECCSSQLLWFGKRLVLTTGKETERQPVLAQLRPVRLRRN